jgi:arginine utilization regulatory protein
VKKDSLSPYMLEDFDFGPFDFLKLLCDFDQGVLMTDDTGTLIFYNSVQANIDKLNPADVLGKKIYDVYTYHNDSSTCMRVLSHGKPIINYALSYTSCNENVGNTIHSVFPFYKDGKIAGTICFVKDYNILERNIPAFLGPKNNEVFAEGTQFTFASIIGSAPSFVNALRTAKMAANSPSPVMIYGETGTGKELFAQAIHNFRFNNQQNYVDINCAAIPESLMEGLLFGTVKGAYTGAVDRAGLLEAANDGTIYLDEINSMPLILQGKLLRALQEKKIRRIGSLDNTPLNCKVICSVNEDPKQLVKNGKFRMDLFYRLAVVYIHIPALRERQVDIEELGRHFLQQYNDMLGKKLKNISPEVINFFWDYSWPGNVRELQHIIESAVNIASCADTTLNLEHCYIANLLGITNESTSEQGQKEIVASISRSSSNLNPQTGREPSLSEAAAVLEIENISAALIRSGGNIAAAARSLGVSRQLLNYKINRYNLRPLVQELRLPAE